MPRTRHATSCPRSAGWCTCGSRASGAGVRVDTGVRQGDAITPDYDPMIAKLIVHGADRAQALRRLGAALDEYEVVGVQTNLALLRAIAAHPAFAAGGTDTGFLGRHPELLAPVEDARSRDTVLAAACLAALADMRARRDGASPWEVADGWRLNGAGWHDVVLRDEAGEATVRAWPQGEDWRLDLPGGSVTARAEEDAQGMALRLDGVLRRLRVVRGPGGLSVLLDGRAHAVALPDPLAPPRAEQGGADRVLAPIPARVARVLVAPGEAVVRGAPLLVLEAMKMELTLRAPADGVVGEVRAAVDEMVGEGTELVTFEG